MKRTKIIIVSGLLILLAGSVAILSSYICCAMNPISYGDPDDITISSVSIGGKESMTSSDTESITDILCILSGKRKLTALDHLQIGETTICIDGMDSDGPIHLILEPDSAVFYRDAESGYIMLNRADAIYRTISALIVS